MPSKATFWCMWGNNTEKKMGGKKGKRKGEKREERRAGRGGRGGGFRTLDLAHRGHFPHFYSV